MQNILSSAKFQTQMHINNQKHNPIQIHLSLKQETVLNSVSVAFLQQECCTEKYYIR